MNDDTQNKNTEEAKNCGCSCEDCLAGNHNACVTGLCQWQDKAETEGAKTE